MKWERKKVSEVCELAYGKSLIADSRIPGDYPVYGSAGEVGTHTNYLIEGPGIIIGRKGSVGTVYYEKRNFFPIDTTYYVIPKEGNDLRFLYYKFQTLGLNKLNSDAAVPGLNRNVAYEQSSFYPPLPIQRKIASILSAYDDLIENNLKRIKLLEEKALMEYRILYSSSKLTEFPIEDVWEIKYGKNLPQTKITEKGKYPVYGAAGRIGFYEEFNYEFPVALVTSRGNGSGLAHRTNQAAFVTNNSFAFVPKLDFSEVHFHLAEMILRDLELTQLRSGTAQPQLTIAGLIGVKLKLPNKEALIEFNKIVDPLFNLIHTLEKQNAKLREARDILLPKLMNGEIEV